MVIIESCIIYGRPSDRGESPSYSSLNHSYETLNMSDTAESPSVGMPSTDAALNGTSAPRLPHRPAPPVPAPIYKMTSGKSSNKLVVSVRCTPLQNELV